MRWPFASGMRVAYTVTYYSVDQNRSNTEIFVMNADGSACQQITKTAAHEFNIAWVDDNTIAYISTEGETAQIWTMDARGKNRKQVSNFDGDINGFAISPKGDKILFISDVKIDKATVDIYPDLPKASGMIIEDLMYRHWDTWEDGIAIFCCRLWTGRLPMPRHYARRTHDTPLKPLEGWRVGHPVARALPHLQKLTGKEFAFSTNPIFVCIAVKPTNNQLTSAGYDKQLLPQVN